MRIYIIKNYKKKILALLLLSCLWISMIIITNYMVTDSRFINISLDNKTNISYPVNTRISNIYVNAKIKNQSIKTASFFSETELENFQQLKANGLGLSFSFPSAFTITEQNFNSNEILYHVDFSNKNKEIFGFIQIWNLNKPLKDFLINSKNASPSNYTNFEMKPININGIDGYLWDYTSINNDNSIKALEAFLQKDGKMYRISYFVPTKYNSKEHESIFFKMLNSLKIN